MDKMAVLFLIFWDIFMLFSIVAAPVYTVPHHSLFPCPCQQLSFLISHSNKCEMISHCGFDLHFPYDKWCCTSFFSYLLVICMFSLEKMSIQIICSFLIESLLLLSWRVLHLLKINLLTGTWLTNIFSHWVGWSEAFKFDVIPLIYFLHLLPLILVSKQ